MADDAAGLAPATAGERKQFSSTVASLHAKPLWERKTSLGPGNDALPAHWRYRDLRPLLIKATELVTADEAERRVLLLENPGLPGTTYATQTLLSGLQIILPGEIARAHRHTTNALRFILEGSGAYSTVEGERLAMQAGDFVLTPYWTWHDHGHFGDGPMIWLDALDNPLAKAFGAMFREHYPEPSQPVTKGDKDSAIRWGEQLVPLTLATDAKASPLMVYPYDRSREALVRVARQGPIDPALGVKLRYANPASGGYPFPTIAVFLQWLPGGFEGDAYRATDGTMICVAEGRGEIQIDEATFRFEKHDVLCVPPWASHRMRAETECVLFCYSDRAAQEALGFWRDERQG